MNFVQAACFQNGTGGLFHMWSNSKVLLDIPCDML